MKHSFTSIFICLFLFEQIYSFKYSSPNSRPFTSPQYRYDTKYFNTLIDHFTYKNDSAKFPMRFLISTDHWVKGNAILFYCGNEGDITLFSDNSGFIWELGEQLSSMIVFAEHRYYGNSLPFGNKSFSSPHYFGYLNSEQALADYADLLTYLKSSIDGAENSPVIAFGGSYGGMLAAWFRQKYPNIVAGSLAASAPVLMVDRIQNCSKAYQVLTRAYKVKGNEACIDNVRAVWPIIQNMNNPSGLRNLSKIFRTCKQPLSNVDDLINVLSGGLFNMGMANYPYPTTFLGPMPAWPVTEFCKHISYPIKDPLQLLSSFYQGIQVYFNYTGQIACLPDVASNAGLDDNGWNIQTCTELPMPMCTDGVTDMFYLNKFDKNGTDKQCQNQLSVRPRWGWGQTLFWGDRLDSATNIIFSNGFLDPWSAGGVFSTTNNLVQIITIKNGAHHVDLRGSNPQDTSDIRLARKLEKLTIEKWIRDWKR